MASSADDGVNGVFVLPGPMGRMLDVIASDGMGWEHVSVAVSDDPSAIPTWEEMCYIKDAFWDDEECVVQYHPPKSRYINFHPGVLHLFKESGRQYHMPPLKLV